MKKVLVGVLVILIVLAASAFVLISKELTVSKVTVVRVNENALFRNISNEGRWQKWWPAEKDKEEKKLSYTYNGFIYGLRKVLYNAVDVKMAGERKEYTGRMIIVPLSPDSVAVKWESTFQTSSNPLIRFFDYENAKTISKNMEVILDSLKAFNEKAGNVYAYNIHRTTIKDTLLAVSKITLAHYPSTKEIYNVVGNIREYLRKQGAGETNYPMLNVTRVDSIHYTVMVAIPTDKRLTERRDISFKQFIIYKDKTVTAEVKGGADEIKKAYEELNVYMNDYNLSTPVIHWESLVTDRSKEADTSKWITEIYMPIV